MSEPLNIDSVWIRQIESGQQPHATDLRDHLTTVHNNNTGFTEAIAWNCRDINGKNSYELLADVIDQSCHSSVLDLACGSGVLLDLCTKRFGTKINLSGVDMNAAELQLARERLAHTEIKLHHSMAQDLNFIIDSSIDVILCHWALTLMDPVIPVFVTAKRVLKENGVFAAIIDGDADSAPGYLEIHNIIYKHVQREYPSYGMIELGDPRVRTVEGLHDLTKKVFVNPNIKITPLLLNFNAAPHMLAREVAGFFYASFVLSVAGHRQMLVDLENHFFAQFKDGLSKFIMPVNRLVIRQS
jgi:ubiquinone/menaquinone biosynthesis C-methylase UbiE